MASPEEGGDERCGQALHQAVQETECIHFAPDGIPDTMIPEAVRRGRAGFFFPNYTNAELHYIAMHPDLLAKTTFYRHGKGGVNSTLSRIARQDEKGLK